MNVAFIGLGTMGIPMVQNLLAAGHRVTIYNRTYATAAEWVEKWTAERAAEQATEQAAEQVNAASESTDTTDSIAPIVVTSAQQAAENADIVITCVSDSSDVEAVILGEAGVIHGARPNALVIDMSTISPEVTRQIAQALAEKNIHMIDAPVSGGSEGAQQGTLSIMVGGEAAQVERAMPVLEAMGSTITHVGPIGAGQITKAINQVIVAGTYWSVAEGMSLGLKAGLDMDKVVQAVGSGAAGSWGLSHRSGNMIGNHYPLGFRVRLHQKDLKIALETARELGLPLPMAAYIEQIETGLIAKGYGDEDISAIARHLRNMGSIPDSTDASTDA
jgi:3-hydroxyisobutyrate dehydrogenase